MSRPPTSKRLAEIADVAEIDPGSLDTDAVPASITVLVPGAALRVTPRLRDADRGPRRRTRVPAITRRRVVAQDRFHLGADQVVFHHSPEVVAQRVHVGAAPAGVLLPPVGVAEIAAVADAGERMPPKTTFFWPKARTGVVMRRFADQS